MFEYLLPDGTALPENEVIKLAVQKGLTTDDYVKKNKLTLRPKQKKAEVKKEVVKSDKILENITKYNKPKVVGPKEKKYEPVVLDKQEKIGDYLTSALRTDKSVKSTFGTEEEEGKLVLDKLYAGIPGLTFEETSSASFGDITNVFDAVKAVYIDPVTGKKTESTPLQFDVNVMNASEKDRPKIANANADILKDFFNKNLKNVDLGKNKYLRGLSELKYNKEIANAITPEFKAKVNEEFDAPDLFAPRKEQKVSMAATGQIAMGGTKYTTSIVKPYENELKESKLKILKDNPSISKNDLDIQADKLTRSLLKNNAFNEKKSLVAEDIINKNPDMQAGLYVGSLLANQAAVKAQNKTTVKLKIAENNASTINGLASDCKAILEGKYKTEDEAAIIARKFASLGIQMDPTQTQLVTLKNGNQVSKGFFDAYTKLSEEYNANNLYAKNVFKEQTNNLQKLEDSDIFASAASKNYDLGEKYLGTIGLGFSDLMAGGGYFAAKVLDKVTPFSYAGNAVSKMIYGEEAETSSERLDKWAVGYTKAVSDIRNSYTRDVSFEDAFNSPSNFGKFAAQEISTQIPILTSMIATGGISGGSAAMIGVTSAGSKMADMQTEIAKGSANYSAPEIWLKSIGYGASEIVFESLTTIPILKRAKIALGKSGAEDVIDNSMKAYFKSKTPGFVFDQLLEAAGESGTQVTQNIIDGNPTMQGVDHAAFSGFAMGTIMSGVPYTHGLYLSAFSDYNSKSNIRDLQREQSVLGKQFELATKKAQKKAISSLMTQKDTEITNAIEKQQKLVNNNLRSGVAEGIILIESEKAKLQNEANDILGNKDISTEVKNLLIKDLRVKFNKINSIKQDALNPINMMQDISKFVILQLSDPTRYDNLISQATTSLSATNNPSEDNIKKAAYDLYLKEEINTNINNVSKVEGANLKVYETKKEALAAIKKDKNISDSDKAIIIDEISLGADGYADATNQTQVVIKENMFNNQRTQIASHEIGHYVFDKIFSKNVDAFIPIANQLLETTKKIDKKLYDKLVKDTERGVDNKLKATEVVSRFLELVSKDDISFAEKSSGFLSGLFGSMIQKQFINEYDFDFKGQTDMFNFVVGLGKKIKNGELTLKEIEAASESKVVEQAGKLASSKTYNKLSAPETSTTAFSKVEVDEIQKKIDKLEEQYDKDEIEYDYYDNQIGLYKDQLKKAKLKPEVEKPKVEKPKKEASDESSVKEIIKENKGKISSDKVQEIYDKKGVEGALEIMKLFKPITARIVDKRRDAPGFSEPDLTYEIENGKGGILDLIMKYDPEEGIPLAAYINKYLPVRAITASRRILDKEFTSDVETEVNVRATETADQGMTINAPEKPKYKDAIESNILEPKVLETLTNKIISTVRLLKSRIDAPITLNRTVTPLIAEIRDDIGKQLDIDIKTMLGGKKDGVLKKELLKAKRYILENMTTTWLMGKDGQGGIPQAIQKRIDGQWVSFPNWVGQKIDRETMSTDLAGRTSGHELVRRLPNVFNNVSNEEFLAQIIGPDGNPIRGRKESVSKAMAEEIAFDITKRDLEEEGPIYDAIKANQERLGVEILENFPQEFAKQADRGNIKLSKSIVKGINISTTKLGDDIFNAPNLESEIKVINNWIASDGRSIRTLAYTIFGKDDERATNLGLFKQIIAPIIKANSKFEGLLTKDTYNIKQGARGYSIYLGDDKIPLWKDTESIKKNWENNISAINSEAIEATNRLIDIVDSFKKNKKTEDDLRSYFSVLKFDQRGLARKVSKAGLGVLGLKTSQKPYLEHNAPNYDIMERAVDYFNKKITEKQLRKFIENSKVNLVPAELNNFLPAYKEGQNRMHDPKVVLYLQDLIDKGHTILNIESEYGSKRKFNALVNLAKSNVVSEANIINANNINAVVESLSFSKTPKGISVFDFDDTVGLTKGSVLYTMPDGSKGKLNAEEFAKNGSSLLNQGAIFDFSEFSKVVGGKPGPMVEKMKKMIGKFGPENFFILTARPANAAGPIHEFLSSIGIYIPLENITGLGNSTAQAKADWMTGKAAEGYNDFYFSDDAIQNVKAVKDALNVLDVKSKIQQARLKFSKTISPEFNKILEENVGVKVNEKFSDIVAKRKGAAIGKYRFFVPPSAADLELLTYDFLGYGKKGEEQQKFFNQALFEPYANGIALIDAAKQSIKNDYRALLKAFPEVSKELGKLTPDGNFTYDQALRVSMWASMGEEIPGLLKEDSRKLNDFVNQDPQLSAFKAGLIATGRQGTGWVTPTEYWDSETIISDLHNITDKVGRKKYLGEFIENSQEMFSKENLNKIETIYGSNFRDALEDSIYSMTNGTNREGGAGRINAKWLNWINNSTGAIMFWNTKSAVLQTIGAINYLNWRDNNPLNAAKAFADQPQYWEDFAHIWNSDKMKERRSGLKEDVSSAEIANAAAGTTNKANAVISYLLKKGFLPTQIGDSFAIASGGAPFYRNRINYNLKQEMSQEEAEANAWKEFVKVTDQTQQSGDPRDVSQQQRSAAGRLVLAFQNTSMQQARLVKKAGLDLINNRGDAKTNISKIVYYTAVQNIIFGALQSALFATFFSDDDDEEKKKKKQTAEDKWLDIGNGIVDTILRGSGMAGAIVATIKNTYLRYNKESKKGYEAEYAKVLIEAANIAPPIGSKFQKGYGAMSTNEFEKDVIAKRGWSVMQDGRLNLSPSYSVLGQTVEAATNLPMNRFVNKVKNVSEAMDSRNKSWQRIALAVGYNPYAVGAKDEEGDIIKAEAKAKRKIEGKEKAAETRAKTKEEFAKLPWVEQQRIKKEKRLEKAKTKTKKRNIYK